MQKLQQILKNTQNSVWNSFKDSVFPRKLRRPYTRNLRDTKKYYPWNPLAGNEYEPKQKEFVENDFRVSYKDSDQNIRFEDTYFRKEEYEQKGQGSHINLDEIEKFLEKFSNEINKEEMEKLLKSSLKEEIDTNDVLMQQMSEAFTEQDKTKLKSVIRNLVNNELNNENNPKESEDYIEKITFNASHLYGRNLIAQWDKKFNDDTQQVFYDQKERIYKGDPSKWDVLDESFTKEQRQQTQQNIDPNFMKNEKKNEGNSGRGMEYLDYPPKNKYI